MMRKYLAWVVGGALALAAAPAAADHGDIHPTFRQEQVYFKCVGANKVQNFDAPAPWDTSPPAASVQDGAGCGSLDLGLLPDDDFGGEEFDAAFAGEAVGNLRTMTVELYIFPFTNLTVLPGEDQVWITVSLVIDGEEILNPFEVHQILWEETNSGVTQKVEFTIVGLDAWFATEDGDGESVRDVQLTIGHDFEPEVGAWVWDTTEVPSGITFNDTTPAAYTIGA